jgi:transcriptional regulator GlxA family with amidase domain
MPTPLRLHQVAVLALPGVLALDFGIPVHAFGNWDGGPYAMTVCTEIPGPVPLEGAPALLIEHGLEALADADTIVVPGQARPVPPSEQVRAALATAAARGTRMVSICTGAFVLAAAGLLDGRRATTHWQQTAALARDYPAVTVDPDVLYIDEGSVLTSAGVAAGIDLCLHIIRIDAGAMAANQRARALRHLDEPLSVDQMAREACLSRRTLIRRFHDETGLPPMQWLLGARIDRARELLEASDAPMQIVARRSGLGTPANLRTLFKRHTGVPPSAYRSTFHRPAYAAGAEDPAAHQGCEA